MNKFNPFAVVKLEAFAVDTADLNAEIAQAQDITDFIAISAGFSIATGHRPGGDPIVFIRARTAGSLHAVVLPDPDERPDPRMSLTTH